MRDLEGKMCELIREPGLKPVHKGIMMAQNPGSGLVTGSVGECAEILGMCQKGLVQIKEVSTGAGRFAGSLTCADVQMN